MLARFSDRLWLALRIMRGEVVRYTADADSTMIVLDFRDRDRARLQAALRNEKLPRGNRASSGR